MNKLISNRLWPTVEKLARSSASKHAAIAYVTSDSRMTFEEGDTLITDASDQAIASGQTDAGLLRDAYERGAELFSMPNLHMKILVLDGTAVIGSANLSDSSFSKLLEAAWITDSPRAVAMTSGLILQLSKQATTIDRRFLSRILKIKVKKRPYQGGSRVPKPILSAAEPRVWLVGTCELTRDYPEEQEAIEQGTAKAQEKLSKRSSDVDWVRMTGHRKFTRVAKPGDIFIYIWSKRGAKKPTKVYRHVPVIGKQVEKACTRFFTEDYSNIESTKLTWKQFCSLARRAGLPKKIGQWTTREITSEQSEALEALWRV